MRNKPKLPIQDTLRQLGWRQNSLGKWCHKAFGRRRFTLARAAEVSGFAKRSGK